jgi:formylaminopyrimidine deformylase / aminopyrimidine aminohydrolase
VNATRSISNMARADEASWAAASTSPFLDGVRDGTLPDVAFDRWLEQDRLFLVALTRAWARVIAGGAAPVSDLPLLAGGVSGFVAEIEWFDDVASTRGLDLGATELPAAAAYNAWLLEVAQEPYAVALAAFWAVEAAYLEAWTTAAPGADPYRSFVEHWTSPEFAAFVSAVEGACDRALAVASDDEVAAAADAVRTTLRHERAFWDLTLDA